MRQLQEPITMAKHGDARQALALTNALLEQHPDFVPGLKLQGVLLEEQGRGSEAAVFYQRALKLVPNDVELLLKLGVYMLKTSEDSQAVDLLLRRLRILPRDGKALFYLAQAYYMQGEEKLALNAIEECVKVEPDNPTVWQKYGELLCSSGDYDDALKWLFKAQRADEKLSGLDYDIGLANYKVMDIAGAAKFSTRAVETQPTDVRGLELLASVEVKLSDWQNAKGAFERILTLKHDDTASLLGLGRCDFELHDYQRAVGTLQSALRLDPTMLLAHFYLSRALAAVGRTAEAQHEAALHHLMMDKLSFLRSMQSNKREDAIKVQTRQLVAEHREEDALRLYHERFRETSATVGDSYVFVGKLYLLMGDTEDGLRCLHHALTIEPTVRGAHTSEGILALKLGDLNKAENEFTAELANDPNYQMAIAEMGEIRYRQGRWKDAAELLAMSRTMNPELLYLLCDSYFHLGNVSDAALNAEMLAAYGRNDPQVMKELLELLRSNGQSELAQRMSPNLGP